MKTATEVATTHGIAPKTVYSITQKASPELLELAENYHEVLVEQGKLNVLAGLRSMHPKMADPATPIRELAPR